VGKIADSSVFAEYSKTPDDNCYDFYRCYKCHAVITREQEVRAFLSGPESNGVVCACGSSKYTPGWPTGFGWLKPSVVRYTFKLFLARVVAPWCEQHWPKALPRLERMVAFD